MVLLQTLMVKLILAAVLELGGRQLECHRDDAPAQVPPLRLLRLERVDSREFDIEPLPTRSEPEPVIVMDGGGLNVVIPMVKIQPKFPRRF